MDAPAGWRGVNERLKRLLTERELKAASRTTINAHYTDPRLVEPIWSALHDLGVPDDARVLEPGCGSGFFLAAAPSTARLVGVELDPTTAAIAGKLNPGADVRAESFADSRSLGAFDAVIGNVPFSEVVLHDPVYNRAKLSMHNHFIAKSLQMTAPGGLVAVLTSRWTMDAQSPEAREQIAELGELVTAIRLPTGAHNGLAGTEAITDLLILRRHIAMQDADTPSWIDTAPMPLPHHEAGSVRQVEHVLNRWWHEHPELVLGDPASRTGRYGPELTIRSSDSPGVLGQRLAKTLADETARLRQTEQDWAVQDRPAAPVAQTPGDPSLMVGRIDRGPGGRLQSQGPDGSWVEIGQRLTADQRTEVRALVDLRDRYVAVITAEAADLTDTPALIEARAALSLDPPLSAYCAAPYGHTDGVADAQRSTRPPSHRRHRQCTRLVPLATAQIGGSRLSDAVDGYHSNYGAINRYTSYLTGKPDADGNRAMARRTPPAMALFRSDPFAVYVSALEEFDDTTQRAVPAAITERRVLAPRELPDKAQSPADAIALLSCRRRRAGRGLTCDRSDLISGATKLIRAMPERASALLRGVRRSSPSPAGNRDHGRPSSQGIDIGQLPLTCVSGRDASEAEQPSLVGAKHRRVRFEPSTDEIARL